MIDKIIKSITIGFFILFPIFYLPITPESYEYNKMVLLVVTTLTILFLTSLKIARARQLTISKSPFTLPLFFLAATYLISTLFQSPNLVLTFITPLSTSTIVASFLFFVLLNFNLEKDQIQKFFTFLVIDACVISLFVLLQQLGILPNNYFTPVGSILATTSFLAIIALYLVAKIASLIFDKNIELNTDNIFYFLALLLVGGTTILLTIQLATNAKPIVLPFIFGWTIFLEVAKNARTLLMGVGPTNFITAFSITKPLTFNTTPFWNVIFTSSSSFLLNLATEAGILAGFFYLAIILKALKSVKLPTTITLIFALILQILLPSNMTVLITTIILLASVGKKEILREFHFLKIRKLSYLLILPTLILVGVVGYFGAKFYWAEVSFKQSLDALLNNNGSQAYNFQSQAINLNPSVDRYHVAFSRTSLALANAFASKSQLSEADKGTIPNLVKQAISEARTAVILNRTNEINWDNLARTYSAIIGYAQGAENWAAYSFQQKLFLDPLNPNTYLALADLNLELNKFIEAENLALRAVNLKPDLANAHYFLNLSLQGQKRYKEAYTELQKTYSLLQPDSADGKKVADELIELAKLVPKEEATTKTNVSATDGTQTLETTGATPSALQNVPETIPTISLPQVPNQ